jgi:hypothetical protein
MEIKYQAFETDHLFIQKFFGVFEFEKYIKYTQEIISPQINKDIKKVLIDFRSLEIEKTHFMVPDDFEVTLDKMTKFRKKVNQKELKDMDVQVLMWVEEPLPTLMAHLFIGNFSNKDYNHCSTPGEIIEIFKLPEYYTNLNEIVNNLENTYGG